MNANLQAEPVVVQPSTGEELFQEWRSHIDAGDDLQLPGYTPPVVARTRLDLSRFNRVIEFPRRDMTITVETGITFDELQRMLAEQNLWLPVSVPTPATTTVADCLSGNLFGGSCLGHGTIRDYVLGMTALDGRGREFHAGGKVVKNVAGYDLCKLMIGSRSTLGLVTDVTLHVKPKPEFIRAFVTPLSELQSANELYRALMKSPVRPVTCDLLNATAWPHEVAFDQLIVVFAGNDDEVEWQHEEWRKIVTSYGVTCDPLTNWLEIEQTLFAELSAPTEDHSLVILGIRPERWTTFRERLEGAEASVWAHCGNGILRCKVSNSDLTRFIKDDLHEGFEMFITSGDESIQFVQLGWFTERSDWNLMTKLKRNFDPQGLLNPGTIFPATAT